MRFVQSGRRSRALRETAAKQPPQVELLPLRPGALRPTLAANRNRENRLHRLHRKRQSESRDLTRTSEQGELNEHVQFTRYSISGNRVSVLRRHGGTD